MADRQYIRYTIEERVATLVIDHPPVNAFNRQVVVELDGALDELLANADVKVIIITGGGQMAFVAGADLNEIKASLDRGRAGDIVGSMELLVMGQGVLNKVEQAHKPVIAAIARI